MKVLLVTPHQKQANGGIAVWTDMFLDACQQSDIEPTVLNIAMTGRRLENGSAKRNLFDEISRTCRIFRDLRSLLKKEKYDVVHINTSCARFGIIRDYLTAKRIKKKQPSARIVLHCNCDIPNHIKSRRSFKYLSRLVALSDRVLVLCDSSAEYLMRHFGMGSVKVPNFIDSSKVRGDEREVRDTLTRVIFVGRVSPSKGAYEIIELARRMPDISFELVGAVSREIEALSLPENVSLAGQLPNSELLFRMDNADLFLFPSHSEGFSIALLESMARALPAVATDVGASRDMLSGGAGIVVPPRDVDAMEAAIRSLSSKESRANASALALKRVKEQYTTERVMELVKKCYLNENEDDVK